MVLKKSISSSSSSEAQQKLVAAALRRLETINRQECFDPVDPTSRPTKAQQEFIDDFGKVPTQWIVAANQSGKSQSCARLVAWFIEEHLEVVKNRRADPNPKTSWGAEPLLVLVMGRTGKQLEESLWPKIRSLLQPGTFKEVRLGNILQRVEMENGNRIVFQSLENPNLASERIQSYVAHLVWIDEMPPTMKVLAEAMVRRNSRSGYFMASFTPLVVNDEIRRMVDAAELPNSKKYIFRMFDNPVYQDPERQVQILKDMAHLPEHVRNTRLFGQWSISDDNVYYFHYESMVQIPVGYSPLWRHVESVDPALKSALGYTLWAENPASHKWYLVKAEEIRGIQVPTQLVEAVKERSKHYNVIRRVSDPHEVWYIQTAASMGIHYIGVHKKNERKAELIKHFQEALGTWLFISPTEEDFLAQMQECRWSDKTVGKMINASSYHLLDAAQYFVDNKPRPENKIQASSWEDWLYKANDERKKKEDKVKDKLQKIQVRRSRWR